jgi:antitoxin component YwqK of YwqJK toxin-antitoxin module
MYTYYENGRIKEAIEITADSIRNGIYKGYNKKGALIEISSYLQGELDGERRLFYDNGNPEGIENYKDGFMNGEFRYFYDNGNIKTMGNSKQGMQFGQVLSFFENDSGKISAESNYLIVKGKSVRTMLRQFDLEGRIVKESPYVNIEMNDSIRQNAIAIAKIELINPKYELTHFVIGDFDEDLDDITIDLKSKESRIHVMKYSIDTSKKGKFILRGVAIHHFVY